MKSAPQKELEKLEREYETLLWDNLELRKKLKAAEKELDRLRARLSKLVK